MHFIGQRHEDSLGAPARLQAEEGAAVVDQIELDVATAPVQLKSTLLGAIGLRVATLEQRQIGVPIGVADGLQKSETTGEPEGIEVIEENTTDTARLLPMRQIEITIAGLLPRRIEILASGAVVR